MTGRFQPKNYCRRGTSLFELVVMLLVVGAVFVVLSMRVTDMMDNIDAGKAQTQLRMLVQAVRFAHPYDIVGLNENFEVPGMTPDMVGNYQGKRIIFNPWRGGIDVFPGNAVGWGTDTKNPEFTIAFSGLSPKACAALARLNADPDQRIIGMTAMYFSAVIGQGKPICFAADSYCYNPTSSLAPSMIPVLCGQHNPMTVMFTFQAH